MTLESKLSRIKEKGKNFLKKVKDSYLNFEVSRVLIQEEIKYALKKPAPLILSGAMLGLGMAPTIKALGQTEIVKDGLANATLEAFVIDNMQGTAWNDQNTAILYKNAIHPDSVLKTVPVVNGQIYMQDVPISPLGINEIKIDPSKLRVYPNPTSSTAHASLNLTEPADVTVRGFNLAGQEIINYTENNQNIGQNDFLLDIGNRADGIYLLNFTVKEKDGDVKTITKKLLKNSIAPSAAGVSVVQSSFKNAQANNYILVMDGPFMEETIIDNITLTAYETTDLGTVTADIDETIVQATVQDENGNLYNNEHSGIITQSGIEKGSSVINAGNLDIPIYIKNSNDLLLALSGPVMQDSTLELMIAQAGIHDMGTLIINSIPDIILTSKVYDLSSKWSEAGERLPTQGIEGMKAYLKSNPDNYVLTGADGKFEINLGKIMPGLMVDSLFQGVLPPSKQWGLQIMDSLFVEGINPEDTTYYSFKTPVGQRIWVEKISNGEILEDHYFNPIGFDTNMVTAFNDTTGIAMFERYVDPENGVDMLEHLKYVTNIEEKFEWHPYWEHITSRMKDEDMVGGIKVFLDRDAAPNEYYADKAWEGIKAGEAGRFKFQEVDNYEDAFLVMQYTNNMIGQGSILSGGEDEFGQFLSKFAINIRGPPGGPALEAIEMVYVNEHETYHIPYTGGNHSSFIQDVFYNDAMLRQEQGLPLPPTTREVKGIETLYNLERNPKLTQWFK